jgi:hypothetical protein
VQYKVKTSTDPRTVLVQDLADSDVALAVSEFGREEY